VVSFSIEIESVRAVSKLHQQFPEADRRAIADHLNRCKREDARAIAARMLATLAAASCAP
jgi:predicted FMN-binding regulatory protein PaiB